MADEAKTITLPALPYEYTALEPYIDKDTMVKHHSKHHQGYTTKFSAAFATLLKHPALKSIAEKGIANAVTSESLDAILKVDSGLAASLQNNGGGWINHTLFWNNMAPHGNGGGGEPTGTLAEAINREFGDFAKFKAAYAKAGATRFGSGWVWLVKYKHGIKLYSTANQDGPHNTPGETPLLGLDVWEHAYYLKYQNDRPGYIDAWWNIVNWPEVQNRYDNAQ